jgi:hypothetical protein
MTQPAIAGSRTFVGPHAGGEGPWYYKDGAPVVLNVPDCLVGDTVLFWIGLDSTDSLTLVNCEYVVTMNSYPHSPTGIIFELVLVRCTVAGTVTVHTNSPCLYGTMVAHKTQVTQSL